MEKSYDALKNCIAELEVLPTSSFGGSYFYKVNPRLMLDCLTQLRKAAQSPAVEVVPDTVAGKVIYEALNRRESILSALKRAGFSIVELKPLKSPESE